MCQEILHFDTSNLSISNRYVIAGTAGSSESIVSLDQAKLHPGPTEGLCVSRVPVREKSSCHIFPQQSSFKSATATCSGQCFSLLVFSLARLPPGSQFHTKRRHTMCLPHFRCPLCSSRKPQQRPPSTPKPQQHPPSTPHWNDRSATRNWKRCF